MSTEQQETKKLIIALQKLEDANINTDKLAYATLFIVIALFVVAISSIFGAVFGLFARQLLASACFIVGFIFLLLSFRGRKTKKSAPDITPDAD